jgi:hypothetical protein
VGYVAETLKISRKSVWWLMNKMADQSVAEGVAREFRR